MDETGNLDEKIDNEDTDVLEDDGDDLQNVHTILNMLGNLPKNDEIGDDLLKC